MKKYGLIGLPLSHTYSPTYFTEKFKKEGIDAEYKAYELDDITQLRSFIKDNQLSGLNVTIPYKKSIMRHLDR